MLYADLASNPSSLSVRCFLVFFLPTTEFEFDSSFGGGAAAAASSAGFAEPKILKRAASYRASRSSRVAGNLFLPRSDSLSPSPFPSLELGLVPFSLRLRIFICGIGGGGVLAAVDGLVISESLGGLQESAIISHIKDGSPHILQFGVFHNLTVASDASMV